MTKLSFLFFTGLVAALLFLVLFNGNGYRSTVAALIGFAFSAAPAALYLMLCGRVPLANAMAYSFGTPLVLACSHTSISQRYHSRFAWVAVLFHIDGCRIHISFDWRRSVKLWPDFVALSILIIFGIVALKSPNREIRFEFPVIVALPFLTAILLSGKRYSVRRPAVAFAAGLVFCGLLASAVPVLHRADRESLAMSNAVLAHAAQCKCKTYHTCD